MTTRQLARIAHLEDRWIRAEAKHLTHKGAASFENDWLTWWRSFHQNIVYLSNGKVDLEPAVRVASQAVGVDPDRMVIGLREDFTRHGVECPPTSLVVPKWVLHQMTPDE